MTLRNNRKNIIGILVISALCAISYVVGNCTRDKVRENGVWVTATIEKVDVAPKGGMDISFHFDFNNQRYTGGVNIGGKVSYNDIGKRLVIMISVKNPNNQLIGWHIVPTWFTLNSPPEGWKTQPAEAQMREMMTQDSIKRGLK